MRMLMQACFMSYVLCSAAPRPTTSLGIKRKLDDTDNQIPKKQTRINSASESPQYVTQQNPNNLAQNSIVPNTCGLCGFKHNFENVSQNRPMKIHGCSLLQIANFNCDATEQYRYFYFPMHLNCSSFKFLVFGKFHANIRYYAVLNRARVLIELSFNDVVWLVVVKQRLSYSSNTQDTTDVPLISIDGWPKYSNTEAESKLLNTCVDSVLPEHIKFHIKKYSHAFENGEVSMNETELTPLLTNQFKGKFNSQMCKEMLEKPFEFYMYFE